MLMLDQGFLIIKEHQVNKKSKDKKSLPLHTASDPQNQKSSGHRSFEALHDLGQDKEIFYQINASRDPSMVIYQLIKNLGVIFS